MSLYRRRTFSFLPEYIEDSGMNNKRGFDMMILQAAAIAMALSIDAFTASFAYGSNQIKIPMRSIQTINLICSGITGLSLLAGTVLKNDIPEGVTTGISFTVLFLLGLTKLLDSLTKSIIRKHTGLEKKVQFTLFNFRFILKLYANPEQADVDSSKTLVPSEAVSLAVALSLDGIAVGFGAVLGGISAWAIFFSSLVINMLCLMLGAYIGGRIAHKISFDVSWLGGAILMIMAITKLL